MMLTGFGLIKILEFDANNPQSKSDMQTKMVSELIANEYKDGDFSKRAVLIITLGAIMFSVMTETIFGGLIRRKDKWQYL